jgi:hypothetical protein
MGERERGQVLPLVALVMAGAGVAMLWLGRLGGAAVARAEARTAADAAALAGAVGGRGAAQSAAVHNGARLVAFEARAGEAFVRVTVRDAVATAEARVEAGGFSVVRGRGGGVLGGARFAGGGVAGAGPGDPGGGIGDVGALAPALRAAIARATALLGRSIPITSGYRSRVEQQWLYDHRATNPYPVARPGFSAHELGLAIDVPPAFVPTLLPVAAEAGLCHPYPVADPVHFELCR